jgi:hypothetical protein
MKAHSIVLFSPNKTFLLTGLVLGALTCSCGEEFPEPMFTSCVIQGTVRLVSSSEGTLDGFLVTAQGPYEEKSASTNSNGNFEINGLGNGTYKLEISKAGFGTKYQYGIQLFGDDTVGVRDELYERVNGSIPALKTVETQLTSFSWLNENSIAVTTNKTSGTVPARVFMAEHKDVSYKNYQWTGNVHSLYRNGFEHLLLTVNDIPFASGKKIYLKMYICNPEEYGYLNYYTGLWTFSTLDPDEHSEEMSFTMP